MSPNGNEKREERRKKNGIEYVLSYKTFLQIFDFVSPSSPPPPLQQQQQQQLQQQLQQQQ